MKSTPVELLCAIALLCYGLWRAKSALDPRRPVYVVYLLATATALTFGAGPLIAFLYGRFHLPEEAVPDLAMAYAAVGVFLLGCEAAGYLFGSEYWRPSPRGGAARSSGPTESSRFPSLRYLAACEAVLVFVRLYFGWEYGIFFSGSGTEARVSGLSYTAVIVYQLAPILGGACLLGSFLELWSRRPVLERVAASAIIAMEVAWMGTQGRRNMLEAIVIGIMAYRFAGGRINFRASAAVVATSVALWFVVFPAFLSVRVGLVTGVNASESRGLPVIAPTYDPELAQELHSANAVTRPLIIRFIVRISEDQAHAPFMYGRALASSLIRTIPAAIAGKKVDTPAPERAIQDHYRQLNIDTSTTWPAVGTADFGLLGSFMAGLLFASALVLSTRLCLAAGFGSSIVYLSLLAFIIHSCVFVEECPSGLWSGLRNVGVLAAVSWFVTALSGARNQSVRQSAWTSAAGARKGIPVAGGGAGVAP